MATIAELCSADEQSRVLSWLREFNDSQNGEFMSSLTSGAEAEFFLVARDAQGQAIGGLRGATLLKWLKIDVMAVEPGHRGAGIGRRLVLAAEDLATRRGCELSYVDTMSFQAPGFYVKLGYQESGRLQDWDSHGHDKVLFTKKIPASSPPPDREV